MRGRQSLISSSMKLMVQQEHVVVFRLKGILLDCLLIICPVARALETE